MTERLEYGLALVLAEVGYRLEVWHRRPVSHTNSILRWHSRSRRRLDCTLSINVNLQRRRRMAGRPSCRLWLDAAKAQPGQIKLIDKNIDRPDRIVLAQIVI
jgi:hypothetical protein